MRRICDDLEAEHESLDALVSGLEPARWDTPTPAEGWTVRDQIAHLAYSDVSARLAVVDAEAWRREFVVTRRRHVADTDLVTEGEAAREWMEIAQAFAGPPGPGRRPGQFPQE